MTQPKFRKKALLSALSLSILLMTEVALGGEDPRRMPLESNLTIQELNKVQKTLQDEFAGQTVNTQLQKTLQDDVNKQNEIIAQKKKNLEEVERNLNKQKEERKSMVDPRVLFGSDFGRDLFILFHKEIMEIDAKDQLIQDLTMQSNEIKMKIDSVEKNLNKTQAQLDSLVKFHELKAKEEKLIPAANRVKEEHQKAQLEIQKEDEVERLKMEKVHAMSAKQSRVQAIQKEKEAINKQIEQMGRQEKEKQYVELESENSKKRTLLGEIATKDAEILKKTNEIQGIKHSLSTDAEWKAMEEKRKRGEALTSQEIKREWEKKFPIERLENSIKPIEAERNIKKETLKNVENKINSLNSNLVAYIPLRTKLIALEDEEKKLLAELNPPRTLKSAVSQKLEPQIAADEVSPKEDLAPAMPSSDTQQQEASNDASMSSLTADCEKNIKTTTAQIETLTEENNQLENLIKQQSLCKISTSNLEAELHQLENQRKALIEKLSSLKSAKSTAE